MKEQKSPYRALRELAALSHRAYAAMLRKLIGAAEGLGAGYVPTELGDAAAQMRELVADHHTAFAASVDGFAGEAFDFGTLLAGASPKLAMALRDLPLESLRKEPAPRLTPAEREARDYARKRAGSYIVGLGNRVANDMVSTAVEADAKQRRKLLHLVRREVAESISKRRSWRELSKRLRSKTRDWSRDFGRIAATEQSTALQEGIAASATKAAGGDPKRVRVAKLATPDACEHCVRLHLTNGPGTAPRIFTLNELIRNGSNVGRKPPKWRAVVPATHPWCHCTLVVVPNGFAFNKRGVLEPLKRALVLEEDLRKAGGNLTYGAVVPEHGLAIRVGDPVKRAIIEHVVAQTPRELFDRRVGVTLITEDLPRVDNPMTEHDLGYWTGNEIRLAVALRADKLEEVLRHELGHALNVYLMHEWGGVGPVVRWHHALYRVSRSEGFVSMYARTAPIENAAELSRLYLYDRKRLISQFPRAFAKLDAAYRSIWRERDVMPSLLIGERGKQARDAALYAERRGAPL